MTIYRKSENSVYAMETTMLEAYVGVLIVGISCAYINNRLIRTNFT